MAKPTALTEAGGSKIVVLADSTATTPAAKAPAAVETATSGEATYPVGWQGIATHRDGDKLKGTASDGPGGFDADGAGPVVSVAGNNGGTVKALAANGSGDLQVTLAGETVVLGAGSAAIGKLASNSGVDIGDVTINNAASGAVPTSIVDTSNTNVKPGDATNNAMRVNVVAGSSAGTEFAEDSPHGTGASGPQILGVRRDADTSPVSADGDYHTLIFDNSGALKVNVKSSTTITETNSASINNILTLIDTSLNNIEADVDNTNKAYADETGSTTGATGVLIQGEDGTTRRYVTVDGSGQLKIDLAAHSGPSISVDDAGGSLTIDNAALSVTGGGTETSALRVTLANNSSGVLSVDDNGGSLTVDGTVAVSSVSGNVDVTPASPVATDYLPVRVTDGTNFGQKDGGWDQASLATQRGVAIGITAVTDQTLLTADASNLYNLVDVTVTIFSGTAAPAGKAYVSLFHGSSASGTEVLRVYAPTSANGTVEFTRTFRMPDRGALNQAVTAKLSASLGTNGEYSVNTHAYKTSS